MDREFKIIAALADIHIGIRHISADEMKRQLKKNFFRIVEQFPYLDGIFILGDTLHNVISANSDYAVVFTWFANRIYKLARKKGATVIWVVGTLSHDAHQMDLIKHYSQNDDNVDFRVYDTIEEDTIWKDYRILILPDVKVKQLSDIDKYLEKRNHYDLILGHGTIEQLQYVQQESEAMPTKTYVFDAYKLMRACKGPILFGHIHQYQHLNEQFYYIGPFTMLERGWQDAGFGVIGIYDNDRTKFKVEHYLNEDSANYYEFIITKKVLDQIPVDEIIEAIDKLLEKSKENDLVTLRITRGSEVESSDKVMILEARYQKDKRFSIVKKIKSKAEIQSEKDHEELRKKYAYLMDESLDLPVIAYQYYVEDFRPSIVDQTSPAAMLTEQDFIDAFKL